ncbi:unnamed protein product [Nezara viridula]|uniref:Uncharacterized protein n=1 Tax=Nezara viridula TaxID=85310 RepID=A0A9P0HS00_NEZVI|nr:unnamed protein product [Nezara viridula]
MENVFSYLSVCYHRLPYRLLILGLVAVDLLCTVYVICELPPFTGGYNFLTDDRVVVAMRRLKLYGGFSNMFISTIWFHFNKDIISNVEVELNLLGVNLISGAAVRRCLNEISIVFLFYISTSLLYFLSSWAFWTQLTMLIIYFINSSFVFGCCGLLSCSLLQLGSFFNDFLRFNKHQDSVLKYQRISTVLEKVCHLFKLPMFLIISYSFILSLFNLYILFSSLRPNLFWTNVFLFFCVVYYQYPLLMVIRSCTELNKKVIAKLMIMKYNFQVFRYKAVTETLKIQVHLQFDAIHCMGIYDK